MRRLLRWERMLARHERRDLRCVWECVCVCVCACVRACVRVRHVCARRGRGDLRYVCERGCVMRVR